MMKLSIGKKLGLGFGVVVVIMILAGSFALYQLNKSAAAFRNVSEYEMTAALAAFGIRANFDEMVWATKNILLRGKDKKTLSKEIEIFNYKKDRLETMWKPLLDKILAGPDVTDEQRRLYDAFKSEYADFLNTWGQALPIYQSQGREAADAILKGKGRTAADPLIELVRSLRAKALKDMEEAAARTRTAVIIILAAFVVAVVIAVISTFSIARELTRAIEGAAQTRRGARE
jgi:methyl-accepting chemotaxis protein